MTSSNDDSIDPIWVYGYHGTSRSRAEIIIAEGFQPSMNGYDWLGTGVYFWQDAPNHALYWAQKIRNLDCAFCDYLVAVTEGDAGVDSIGAIRSAFIEGKQIFPNSAIHDRTHVQISVIKLNLIEYSCIYD